MSHTHYFHILPDELEVSGIINPEVRYRGIYEVLTYQSVITLNGKFSEGSFANLPDNADKIHWEQAKLVMGISDLKGLKSIDRFEWNNTALNPEGGIPYESTISAGINAQVPIGMTADNFFGIDIALNGSESMQFVPAGKKTYVKLSSPWKTPSFDGSIIPDPRNVTDSGFSAEWSTLSLTMPFPQKWSDRSYEYDIQQSAFGVSLLIPVDIYQKTTRSVKYALLFIGLTFLVIFFIEVMSRKKIHPAQYLLIGAALVIFYSLLLALSEHLVFGVAYLIAAAGTIGLIVSYAHSLFRKVRYTLTTGVVLSMLYGFLFAILHMSDLALLLGNIGLFIILAIVMFFSRKIEWYTTPDTKDTL